MILDGKKISEEVVYAISEKIRKKNAKISLHIIYVGDNKASKIYIKNKEKYCNMVGIEFKLHALLKPSEEEVIQLIKELNSNKDVTGIILQSPLIEGINFDRCVSYIDSNKDVDGLSSENIVNNYMGRSCMLPCTVKGIITLLNTYDIEIKGKNACIIGRSNLVGKPLFFALENLGATCTLCHSKTDFLGDFTEKADIIVACCGVPKLIKDYMIRDEAIVIDVGITKIDGHIVGDVDFENVSKKCSFITPVPGGVGPMTVASIIENTYSCYERKQ